MSSDNFPGFDLASDYFERYIKGLRTVGLAWNDVWRRATDAKEEYTFGAWMRDMGTIWSRSQQATANLFTPPSQSEGRIDPVWLSIVADSRSTAANSAETPLPNRVDNALTVEPTNLERLGKPNREIDSSAVKVHLSSERDSLHVSITIDKDKKYEPGTYIGFLKLSGGAGSPLAIIFFSKK